MLARSAGTVERRTGAPGHAANARRVLALVALTAASLAAALPSRADSAGEPYRFSIGLLGGTTQTDRSLADYQWDVTPHLAWGVSALAERGRFGAGLRLWRTQTTQSLGFAGTDDPTVSSTTLEAVGTGRFASFWGVDLLGTASGGWLHMGYDPEHVTIDPLNTGNPIDVRFAPIDEWIAGAGLSARRPLSALWSVGVTVDRRAFALDTSHRRGNEIVTERQAFGEWSARFELSRHVGQR